MAITYDNATAGALNTNNISHTIGSTVSAGIVFVVVTTWARTVSAVTFGGSAMTLVQHLDFTGPSYDSQLYVYMLLGPPAGAGTATATIPGSLGGWRIGVVSYFGVDQATPYGTVVTDYTSPGAGATDVVATSQSDGLVVDFCGGVSIGSGCSYSVGGGQTARLNTGAATGGGNPAVGSSEKAGAASVTMSWDPVDSCETGLIGVPLLPFLPVRGRLVAYMDDLASPDRRLLDIQGNRLEPYEVHADAWVAYLGWAPARVSTPDSLVDDPTVAYIEEISWSSGEDLAQTTTSRMDLGDVIIARASAQSTG